MNLTPEFAPNPHTQPHLKCLNCFAKWPATYSGWKKIKQLCFLLCMISLVYHLCWKNFPTSTAFASNHVSDLFFIAFFWLWINMWLTNWWIFKFLGLCIMVILNISDSCHGIKLFWYLIRHLRCCGCWLAEFAEACRIIELSACSPFVMG